MFETAGSLCHGYCKTSEEGVRNVTVFRENMVKCYQWRLFYCLGQDGPHFFVFVVVIPEILSKKLPLRGNIWSNTDLLKNIYKKKWPFLKVKMLFWKVFHLKCNISCLVSLILEGLCIKWVNISTQKTNIGKSLTF